MPRIAERWKPAPRPFHDSHQVSDRGRVWSWNSHDYATVYLKGGNVPVVSISNNGDKLTSTVARLVARTFLPAPEGEIDRYQARRINPRRPPTADNVFWMETNVEGPGKGPPGELHWSVKVPDSKARRIVEFARDHGPTKAARRYRLNRSTVSSWLTGQHRPYLTEATQ